MNPHIIGIRFQEIGKVYHFDATIDRTLSIGDFAVVETSRGQQLGEVVEVVTLSEELDSNSWKPILRRATGRDMVIRQVWQRKELEATINCREKASELGYDSIKIVAAEYTLDGTRLSILYSSEAEERVDIRKLRSAMQRLYTRSRVDLRQIGPRDVAKIIGGMGACGMANRCCSMFLTEFSPISIKMAKEQGISLTPSEITGMCGRLRCCLVYEYEQYVDARKALPRLKKKVVTPLGEGKVIDLYPLKQAVLVDLGNGNRHEFAHEEVQPWDELEALKKKAAEPCAKHEGGNCNCGNQTASNEQTTPTESKRQKKSSRSGRRRRK